ncbi:MAG: C40 family peptidase [Actinomycetota bacterium]|nr:C40 family peptidase [Actinomycetota bacterium]
MDCSCLTMTVFAEFGISLPDDPQAQMGYGTAVSGAPQAGDLVFWSEDGSGIATHVGIATGNGTVIHASAYAGYVVETPIEHIPGYLGARRLL